MWSGEKTPVLGGSLFFKERSSGYRYGTCRWERSVLNQPRNYFSPLTGGSLKSHRTGFWPLTGVPKSQRTRVKDTTLNCLFLLSWKLLVLWIPVINLSRFFWFWQFSENWNWSLEIFRNLELYFLLILCFFQKTGAQCPLIYETLNDQNQRLSTKSKKCTTLENITVQMGASTRVWEYESL